MRRSTAAAFGTLTGAALIVGVRLSVSAPEAPVAAPPVAAPPAVDLSGNETGASAKPAPSKKPPAKTPPAKKPEEQPQQQDDAVAGEAGGEPESGMKDGVYQGKAAKNPYGTIQVSIKVEGGKVTAADATYPTAGNSATINPNAIEKLKQETLQAQSADVDAVSGATFTSQSYVESLQAALDAAGA